LFEFLATKSTQKKSFHTLALKIVKQGIKNTLALPIDKMLYIYLLCPHSEHQKNPFQSKQSKHFHQRNRFTQCETGSNKVKLPKVGSNAIVPVGSKGPINFNKSDSSSRAFQQYQEHPQIPIQSFQFQFYLLISIEKNDSIINRFHTVAPNAGLGG
jgi:hypothetical protein